MNNIARAMHSDLAFRESRYAENKKVMTVQETYGDRTANMLLLLTRSEDDDGLSEYHLGVSSKPKGLSERVIFQREIDAAADVLGLVPFQVTPSQVMTMKNVYFVVRPIVKLGPASSPSASHQLMPHRIVGVLPSWQIR
jgi:hypothetical protein